MIHIIFRRNNLESTVNKDDNLRYLELFIKDNIEM